MSLRMVYLARAILDGRESEARKLAQEVVDEHDAHVAEERARNTARAIEKEELIAFRAKRDALIKTHGKWLRKQFAEAGRHLGNNGYRWGIALNEAGIKPPGVTGHSRGSVMEHLVDRCLGVQDIYRWRASGIDELHDPDKVYVEKLCAAIRKTADAHGCDREGTEVPYKER